MVGTATLPSLAPIALDKSPRQAGSALVFGTNRMGGVVSSEKSAAAAGFVASRHPLPLKHHTDALTHTHPHPFVPIIETSLKQSQHLVPPSPLPPSLFCEHPVPFPKSTLDSLFWRRKPAGFS